MFLFLVLLILSRFSLYREHIRSQFALSPAAQRKTYRPPESASSVSLRFLRFSSLRASFSSLDFFGCLTLISDETGLSSMVVWTAVMAVVVVE